MLARRFTIVCLLVTIFGMGMTILAADRGTRVRSGFPFTCDHAAGCLALPGR